jgi:hemerythrin HHE cation binding domain-containing protein
MATPISQHSVYELTQREHEQIRGKLKFLHQQLKQQQASVEEVERLFVELRSVLVAHFHNEECDGFFDQIVARAPQLSRKADSLTREHMKFLGDLDSLVRIASGRTGQPACWHTLSLRFEEFVKQLMHHECEENGMLQQAYIDDLGTKD